MKKEQVIEFAEKSELCSVDRHGRVFSGLRDDVEIHEELMSFAKMVEQAALERVAQHFDVEENHYVWCDWSDGKISYEIRNMANGVRMYGGKLVPYDYMNDDLKSILESQ